MSEGTLTWDVVCALDGEALNLAVEHWCLGHVWQQETVAELGQRWVLRPADGGTIYSSVPHLHTTAQWEACMALCWRYGLAIHAPYKGYDGYVCLIARPDSSAQICHTEAEARRAICQLAVWAAIQHAQAQG